MVPLLVGIIGYVGENNGIIRSCWNSGKISSKGGYNSISGGIVGIEIKSTIKYCYSIGECVALGGNEMSWAAGICGTLGLRSLNNTAGTMSNCYTTFSRSATNYYYRSSIYDGVCETEDDLKEKIDLLGEDFVQDKKNINRGFPILKWQLEKIKN